MNPFYPHQEDQRGRSGGKKQSRRNQIEVGYDKVIRTPPLDDYSSHPITSIPLVYDQSVGERPSSTNRIQQKGTESAPIDRFMSNFPPEQSRASSTRSGVSSPSTNSSQSSANNMTPRSRAGGFGPVSAFWAQPPPGETSTGGPSASGVIFGQPSTSFGSSVTPGTTGFAALGVSLQSTLPSSRSAPALSAKTPTLPPSFSLGAKVGDSGSSRPRSEVNTDSSGSAKTGPVSFVPVMRIPKEPVDFLPRMVGQALPASIPQSQASKISLELQLANGSISEFTDLTGCNNVLAFFNKMQSVLSYQLVGLAIDYFYIRFTSDVHHRSLRLIKNNHHAFAALVRLITALDPAKDQFLVVSVHHVAALKRIDQGPPGIGSA